MECRKEESMTEKYFPQVGDNELMLTEMPPWTCMMKQTWLVTLQATMWDKNYLEWQPIAENIKPKHPYHQPLKNPTEKTASRKTWF